MACGERGKRLVDKHGRCYAGRRMLPPELDGAIERIRRDNKSGAVALVRLAAEALSLLEALPQDRGNAALGEAVRALVAAQPTMAPLWNLASSVLWARDREGTTVGEACRRFLSTMEANHAAVRRHVAALVPAGGILLTHSHSGTLRDALVAAARGGVGFRVFCTESRPMCEGVILARELGVAGIPVTLLADAAMGEALQCADLVLVGADAVSTLGLTNKMGTFLLAAAARQQKTRFLAACGSEKFLPSGSPQAPETPKPAEEIARIDVPGVTVENRYFDRTPIEWLAGVITEDGVLRPRELESRLRAAELHPALTRPRG